MKAWLLSLWFPVTGVAGSGWLPSGLPPLPAGEPVLCVRDYLTPGQGDAVLRATLQHFDTREKWIAEAGLLQRQIQEGAGLAPWPRRTPLHPLLHARREFDGYSVENVALETLPGVWACGNLYRPLHPQGRSPAVLSLHGHTPGAETPAERVHHGRFDPEVQRRAATLARMGAVVLTLDMFGYGDSLTQFGPEAHRRPLAMTVQLWDAIRAVDFLTGLDTVDASRLAVTGESGGATQTLLLTAVDPRVTVSVPVAMVSSYFFGGCPCESGRPIHRSAGHFASNAVIAALAAPRPMLVVSDGGDWTKFTPRSEFPFLQEIYRLGGAPDAVANVHLPTEGHDYGPSKRAAMYRFLARQFGLNLRVGLDAGGAVDESRVTIESPAALELFSSERSLPPDALRHPSEVEAVLRSLQH